jgi:RNA polymerase sigma factor (sigma-70 family)
MGVVHSQEGFGTCGRPSQSWATNFIDARRDRMTSGLSASILQTQSDQRLVELARTGNEHAFEALVRRHRRALVAYSRRLVPSGAGGEDAVQQALLLAWVGLRRSDTVVRNPRAWLHRIVHNVVVSNLRRPSAVVMSLEAEGGTATAESDFENRLAAREALTGLAALPDLQRQVMLSTALEGRSHQEIAESYGLSPGAVRGLIYRARATLRAAAAALVPAPLVNWVARQPPGGGGPGSNGLDVIAAGGGSVGLAGVLIKGSVVVLGVGAVATAAGVAPTLHSRAGHPPRSVVSQAGGGRHQSALAAVGAAPASAVSVGLVRGREATGGGSSSGAGSGSTSSHHGVRGRHGDGGPGRGSSGGGRGQEGGGSVQGGGGSGSSSGGPGNSRSSGSGSSGSGSGGSGGSGSSSTGSGDGHGSSGSSGSSNGSSGGSGSGTSGSGSGSGAGSGTSGSGSGPGSGSGTGSSPGGSGSGAAGSGSSTHGSSSSSNGSGLGSSAVSPTDGSHGGSISGGGSGSGRGG